MRDIVVYLAAARAEQSGPSSTPEAAFIAIKTMMDSKAQTKSSDPVAA